MTGAHTQNSGGFWKMAKAALKRQSGTMPNMLQLHADEMVFRHHASVSFNTPNPLIADIKWMVFERLLESIADQFPLN